MVSAVDKARVAEAIRAAEAGTAGEIFCVVAAEADDYRPIAALWATLVALSLPVVLLFFPLEAWQIVVIQLGAAIGLGLVFQWRPLRLALVPRSLKRLRAHRMATEMFLAHNIHGTPGRTGVLLFVALAERQAEIVADTGIFNQVEEGEWVALIARLTARLKEGALGDGLVEAIEGAGAILAAHVPPETGGERDHLPNTLVEI